VGYYLHCGHKRSGDYLVVDAEGLSNSVDGKHLHVHRVKDIDAPWLLSFPMKDGEITRLGPPPVVLGSDVEASFPAARADNAGGDPAPSGTNGPEVEDDLSEKDTDDAVHGGETHRLQTRRGTSGNFGGLPGPSPPGLQD
jgi:hypothetical protein